jgi:hypothetical protein
VTLLTQLALNPLAMGAGIAGMASGWACLAVFFRCRAQQKGLKAQLYAELSAAIEQKGTEFSARLSETARKVENLEIRIPGTVAAVRGGIGRSDRSRAMQLLRSGLAPATVASKLNLGAREIHLIAAVSRALSADTFELNPVVGREESRPA